MPQQIVYTDDIEDEIVYRYSKIWSVSKAETIKLMIKRFDKLQKGGKYEKTN